MIMRKAWKLFKGQDIRTMEMFSACLKQSWCLAKNNMKEVNFDVIYKKHYKQVYYYILERVNFKSDIAENLTQDTFVKVFKHLETYEVEKGAISTWLHKIAYRTIIDSVRTTHADKFVSVDNFVDAESGKETFQIADNSVDVLENKQLGEKIGIAMSNLKTKHREVAEIYFIHEKSYNEIADILSIPLGTVKGYISRAREVLQSQLKDVREMV